MTLTRRAGAGRSAFVLPLLALCAVVLLTNSPASAAGIVAKDGKIHACYKAKGKGKGTLRLVRNGKVKCPKRWKKTAWYAAGRPGPQGEQGPQGQSGATGATGATGAQGAPGRNENVVVNELEDKVTELLTKVQSLESILSGINNQQLKEAIAAVPIVGELCTQTKALTTKSGELGTALGGLSTVLDTLTLMGLPSIPTALPPFECP
jgi:hypothetical protein